MQEQALSRMQNLLEGEKCANGCQCATGLLKCSTCALVAYCGKECQTQNWPQHRKICKLAKVYREQNLKMDAKLAGALQRYYILSSKLPNLTSEYESLFPGDTLYSRYIDCGFQSTLEMIKNNINNMFRSDSVTREDELKRWGEISPEWDLFLLSAKPGDVWKTKAYVPYEPRAPQHFRNSPCAEPIKLEAGTTVVDFGFVDFGITIDSIDVLSEDGPPLTVLAYEMEPMCVAKTIIMLEMMRDAATSPRSIVEVWMSSLWSESTYVAFNAASRRVLTAGGSGGSNKKVMDVVRYWASHRKLSRLDALDIQLKGLFKTGGDSAFAMDACRLSSAEDRIQFLRYHRTKALYEDATTTVGSIVMCSENPSIGVKQGFETCVEAYPIFYQGLTAGAAQRSLTFFGRMKEYFESKIRTFSEHLRRGTLQFITKLSVVSLDNEELIREVHSSQPYFISWSNIPDYIAPTAFHAIAKRMSGSDTVHYVHSCNWTQRVYGTDIFDINEAVRYHFFAAGLFTISMAAALTSGGAEDRALEVFHFRDICSVALDRRYVKQYMRYFFDGQAVNCACLNGKTPLKAPKGFVRTVSTAFFTYAYKETGIEFGIDSYDYLSEDA